MGRGLPQALSVGPALLPTGAQQVRPTAARGGFSSLTSKTANRLEEPCGSTLPAVKRMDWGCCLEDTGTELLTAPPFHSTPLQGTLGPRLGDAHRHGRNTVGFFQPCVGQRSFSSGSLSRSLGVCDFPASGDTPVPGKSH